ncbi:MAG: thiamine biosynthesis protein ThiS [Denitrovibrio sp.]|nr:MAG: thiamine biosynthesis protein ThiS [Denitrovibrio sp.]
MEITLNGEKVNLEKSYSLNQIIDIYDMNRETVVVEVNGNLPEKTEYDTIYPTEGDVIELIRFVGGG